MNFLSTAEFSLRWGISARRITALASQGRIAGARQVGGHWLIPEDAVKPQDPRKNKPELSEKVGESYVFPFLLACVHSEEQLASFTPEETALYRLCLAYESGDFREARSMAESLLIADNRYVRLGALFHLPTICMYLRDFEATERYSVLFRAACYDCPDYRPELELLIHELDSELVSMSEFSKRISACSVRSFSDDLMPMLFSYLLMADMTKAGQEDTALNIAFHEVACRDIEAQGYFFQAAYMHCILSVYYAAAGSPEDERFHMKRAIDVALEHGTVFTVAYSLGVNPITRDELLREYPQEVGERFRNLARVFIRARSEYAAYRGRVLLLPRLNDDDYRIISLCLKDYSIAKISESFGMSESGMKKRLAILYSKLGVKTKNELTSVFLNSLLEWGSC